MDRCECTSQPSSIFFFLFFNKLVLASVPEAYLRGLNSTECSFFFFFFPDIEMINHIEEWSVCVIAPCCLFSFLIWHPLSASELGTVQTGDDFSISLNCLKNLKNSWLNLPRTFCLKCFTHDKITKAPFIFLFYFLWAMSAIHSAQLWSVNTSLLGFLALGRSFYSKLDWV